MSATPKTPHCVECSRTDVPLKPANQYEFLAAIGRHIPADLLCEGCAGLICRDLTGNSTYILPPDLTAHWLNEAKE